MTDEYIHKQDAVDAMRKMVIKAYSIEYGAQNFIDSDDACKVLNDLPPADVAPVVHGKWMKEDRGHVEYCAVCDQCGFDWMWSDRGYFKFCPNCGAKMDGERKE